jgi:hypothetical protein
VRSVTCDCAKPNIEMFRLLGSDLTADPNSPFFPHPVTGDRVYTILDPCHLIKLVRNMLHDFEVLEYSLSGKNFKAYWGCITNLHEQQQQCGLRAANKLSTEHIFYKRRPMNVRLAVQLLSSSVATSLDWCRINLRLPQFQYSEVSHYMQLSQKSVRI